MPAMDIDVSELSILDITLESYMYAPTDEWLRNSFFVTFSTVHKFFNRPKNSDYIKMSYRDIESLFLSPGLSELTSKQTKISADGILVGSIAMNLLNNDTPSLSKAYDATTDFTKKIWADSNLNISGSKSHIKKIWSTYKTVSHFWLTELFLMHLAKKGTDIEKLRTTRPFMFPAMSHIFLHMILQLSMNKHAGNNKSKYISYEDAWIYPIDLIPNDDFSDAKDIIGCIFEQAKQFKLG